MDFDIDTVRKLTGLRNKPGLAPHLKQRLTNIINTGEEINREVDPRRRDALVGSFKRQWTEYVVERDKEDANGEVSKEASRNRGVLLRPEARQLSTRLVSGRCFGRRDHNAS